MKRILFFSVSVVIGVIIGFYLNAFVNKTSTETKKPLYWVAPMDPNYKRDKPGKSPMGMDLVPVYPEENKVDDKGVYLKPSVQNHISVKKTLAIKKDLSTEIKTVGFVTVNEHKIEKVHTYVDGWVRNLKVHSNGDEVKKGDLLFELFSPSLNNAQQEYLLAIKSSPSLIGASEKKLKTLGLNDRQISKLKRVKKFSQTVKVFSRSSGVVENLSIREGMYVKPDTELMTIEDLSTIWIDVEIYDKDTSLLKIGQLATARFKAYPGKEWFGEVGFIYPTLDVKTRTLKVRLIFPNPTLALKPNMYADVTLYVEAKQNALVIPLSAVIQTGNMNRVIKILDSGNFMAQEVSLGIESNGEVEITNGLKEGDKVVRSSQFLIDSESNVQDSLQRLTSDISLKKDSKHIFGKGKILKIDVKEGSVTLDHTPIPSINMPSMVMKFKVSKKIDLTKYAIHDEIQFELVKMRNRKYLINFIRLLREK